MLGSSGQSRPRRANAWRRDHESGGLRCSGYSSRRRPDAVQERGLRDSIGRPSGQQIGCYEKHHQQRDGAAAMLDSAAAVFSEHKFTQSEHRLPAQVSIQLRWRFIARDSDFGLISQRSIAAAAVRRVRVGARAAGRLSAAHSVSPPERFRRLHPAASARVQILPVQPDADQRLPAGRPGGSCGNCDSGN